MLINRLNGQKLNLNQVLGLLAASLVLLSGLLISLMTWSHLKDQLSQRVYQDAQRQLQRLTITLAPSLLQQDRVSINVTLQEWMRGPDIGAIRVFNNNQQIIAEIGGSSTSDIEISQSVTQDNIAIGVLRADVSFASARQTATRYLAMSLLQTALLALLIGFLAYALSERLFGYIRQTQQALAQWLAKETKLVKLPPQPLVPELKELHNTLASWQQQLDQQLTTDQALQRFSANPAAADAPMRYQDCFILLIELHNIDSLKAQLSAHQFSQQLERYHRLLTKASKLYNARLEPFANHSIAMLFPIDHEASHEQRKNEALHCLWSASLFSGMVQQSQAQNNSHANIEVRMGIHFGPVLLTHHSDTATQCKLAGDTMQWTAFLTSCSEPNSILSSAVVYEFFADEQDFMWAPGPCIVDFNGNNQSSWLIESLGDKNQSLIVRQVRQLSALLDTNP